MTYADRWLLPEGVEEILPEQARPIELLRRKLVNLYQTWGYDLVIPPLLEYTDSLLTGLGRDVDLLTFKVTDQLTGRTLGVRADITPQTARMDAHSLAIEGANRLCYAGHVVHTKPKSPLATRTPIQAGVEFYGEAGISADIEVVSLLLESLCTAGLPKLHIDLGHVGIYRALMNNIDVADSAKDEFFDMLQRKAMVEIRQWVSNNIADAAVAEILLALPNLAGTRAILDDARAVFEGYTDACEAIDQLVQLADVIESRYPAAECYFDLGEVRGYHYLTGPVFAAFAPGYGNPIASGGRYDHIGEAFGRRRPATGFAVDITALSKLGLLEAPKARTVGVIMNNEPAQWEEIQTLRSAGKRVVCVESQEALQDLACESHLIKAAAGYQIVDA